jgi:AcrR family transcriptional regulator
MQVLKPESRMERTHEALLRAFREIVFARGYDVMSVRDIVVRAHVGRSTFYEHFESKEDLLRESIARPLGVLAGLVDEGCDLQLVEMIVAHFLQNRRLANEFFTGAARHVMSQALAGLVEERLRSRVARIGATSLRLDLLAAYVARGPKWRKR